MSSLHMKSSFCNISLTQSKPSILKCWYGMNWFRRLKLITGRFLLSFFPTRNTLLQNSSFKWLVWHMTPFSNMLSISTCTWCLWSRFIWGVPGIFIHQNFIVVSLYQNYSFWGGIFAVLQSFSSVSLTGHIERVSVFSYPCHKTNSSIACFFDLPDEIRCSLNFLQNKFLSCCWSKSASSLNISFDCCGAQFNAGRMLYLLWYVIEFVAWPSRRMDCSTYSFNLFSSIGTSSSCDERAFCISNQSFDNGPMILMFLHRILLDVAS